MSGRALVVYRHSSDVGPYEKALHLAGIEPVLALASESASLAGVEGLLLTGGGDVNPKLYGEDRLPETQPSDDERDEVELRLLSEALECDMPVFAICRGLQLLNVQHGGTLIQHLGSVARHRKKTADRAQPAHEVTIAPNTLLGSIAGTSIWQVNSRHHQAAAIPGKGLIVSARDPEDGTIEALERPDRRFVLAVQWHPENQAPVHSEQLRLFERFGEAL